MDDKLTLYGVDVAKAELVLGQAESAATQCIANTPQAIAAWLVQLGAGSVIAMEASGHYHRLLAHMAHAAGMVVYVLNPQLIKHYGRAVGNRGKTDRLDARLIARYVLRERSKLRAWAPPAPAVDALSRLLVRRQALVKARQMLAQSLHHARRGIEPRIEDIRVNDPFSLCQCVERFANGFKEIAPMKACRRPAKRKLKLPIRLLLEPFHHVP